MSPPPSATTASGYDGMNDMRPQRPSLSESYRTIAVPLGKGGFWRKTAAFAGPGYMVAVGYMDPGNWATDLAGGSAFGYTLLSVILLSNIMAMVLQSLSAKLGIVTGHDLAQACRANYNPVVNFCLVGAVRAGDHRLRPGRGARHRHRAAIAVRPAAGRGRVPDGVRRAADPGAAALRLPQAGGVHRRAADRDRGLLRL